ncbi:MAG: CidA/LrgA family protein [Cypionkella sp.]|nr:CidA/LrgA family protein [Cypionkella sp.]
MIHAILILLTCQLLGEAGSRAASLPLPGPVLGLMILLAALAVFPALADKLRPVTQTILGNLSLLFVPAGVGVVQHLPLIAQAGAGIVVALVASTVLAITAGALTFAAVARMIGSKDD